MYPDQHNSVVVKDLLNDACNRIIRRRDYIQHKAAKAKEAEVR